MEGANAVGFDAEFAGYSAGIFGVSAGANRGICTAGIAASSRRAFSTFNCAISFRSKAVFFYTRFSNIR
jgi:hypothetical protein